MLIDDQVRIRSLIRAMQDVVIPAITPQAQLAVEQAHLVQSHLNLMLNQADHNYRLQLAELRHFAALLRELIACLPGVRPPSDPLSAAQALLRRAEPIAALNVPDSATLAALTKDVREAADRILEQAMADGAPVHRRAAQVVLEYAKRQITRERVAVKTAGFDLDAATLPDLKDVT